MLHNQIKSLEKKMFDEKTMSANDMARLAMQEEKEREDKFDNWLKNQRNK